MTAVASVAALSVSTPERETILERVDLELPAGAVTAVVGESGAGKTTLAHSLLGHLGSGLHITTGTVRVAGHDPFTGAGRRALRGRITGYLPQDPASALDPRRTVIAQLRTAARLAHPDDSRQVRRARVQEAAEAAALEPGLLRRHPARLSGGQAQRALLAWTLITRPRLLILDEPTSGLDPQTAHRLSAALTDLPWDPAVLLISHDRDLVARIATRCFEMTAGRLHTAPDRTATARSRPPAREPALTGAVQDNQPVLAAVDVSIHRGGLRLLTGASLCLAPGELVAVRGPSGSGKTSLARALCGLTPPDAGQLRVEGASVGWDASARARAGGPFLAYVGQDARAALNPHETVRRTLARAYDTARRRGRSPGEDSDTLLDQFGLPRDLLDRTPGQLSGGQRHRVALARAIAAAPAVLVCDESTASLDHATERLVLDALDTLRRRIGLPVLLITHQQEVAVRADRILTLTGGVLR